MPRKNYYKPVRTMEMVVNEKIQVLKDFFVVNNDDEEKQTRTDLIIAIRSEPDSDMDSVADRFAKTLISEKLA